MHMSFGQCSFMDSPRSKPSILPLLFSVFSETSPLSLQMQKKEGELGVKSCYGPNLEVAFILLARTQTHGHF